MYNLSYITEDELMLHVEETIKKYGEKLNPVNSIQFNKNNIDPIKLTFDKSVYQISWEEVISNEISRQRDKSNNNDIGYFHQNIFKYIEGCTVPNQGWDIIFEKDVDIEGKKVSKIYIEMKNKHNTMNSSSSAKTYMRMQDQLLQKEDCACFLVEVIAKKSQNVKWEPTVDKQKMSHELIRRVSVDKFYELVTGEKDAFYNLCMILPKIIDKVVKKSDEIKLPLDTVYNELQKKSQDNNISFSLALYLLGFNGYLGFQKTK